MRGENLLAGANVPTDPGISQQAHGERRACENCQQGDEDRVAHGRDQQARPERMCIYRGTAGTRTSGTVHHRGESYRVWKRTARSAGKNDTKRPTDTCASRGNRRSRLRRPQCRPGAGPRERQITVIDRKNHHTFQPLLYQVATAGLSPGEIAAPIRSILSSPQEC